MVPRTEASSAGSSRPLQIVVDDSGNTDQTCSVAFVGHAVDLDKMIL